MSEVVLKQQRNSKHARTQKAEEVFARFCDAQCFTPREKQVFLQICTGKKNFVVARELGLSEATIRLHITNIHRKLDTASKVDLVLRAFAWWLALADQPQTERPRVVPSE